MSRDSNDSDAVELAKLAVLELFRDSPGDEVTRGPLTSLEAGHDGALRDLALETHLEDAEDLGQRGRVRGQRSQQTEEVVRGRVRQQLEVIGGVLVVAGHEQRHHSLQEGLAGRVV